MLQVPILAAFRTEEVIPGRSPRERVMACIFKVGDDCRQDVLALQARYRCGVQTVNTLPCSLRKP